ATSTSPCTPLSSFFYSRPLSHSALHSFPTRRSSDLTISLFFALFSGLLLFTDGVIGGLTSTIIAIGLDPLRAQLIAALVMTAGRSEEHTSELQSHLNLVCRLLLEKNKLSTRQGAHSS